MSLRESGKELREFEVAYFAASCDKAKKNQQFAKSLELDYPILSDPDKKVARAYGVVGPTQPVPRRWTFIIGPDGRILAIDKKVKTGFHGQDLVAELEKLNVAKVPLLNQTK